MKCGHFLNIGNCYLQGKKDFIRFSWFKGVPQQASLFYNISILQPFVSKTNFIKLITFTIKSTGKT